MRGPQSRVEVSYGLVPVCAATARRVSLSAHSMAVWWNALSFLRSPTVSSELSYSNTMSWKDKTAGRLKQAYSHLTRTGQDGGQLGVQTVGDNDAPFCPRRSFAITSMSAISRAVTRLERCQRESLRPPARPRRARKPKFCHVRATHSLVNRAFFSRLCNRTPAFLSSGCR